MINITKIKKQSKTYIKGIIFLMAILSFILLLGNNELIWAIVWLSFAILLVRADVVTDE